MDGNFSLNVNVNAFHNGSGDDEAFNLTVPTDDDHIDVSITFNDLNRIESCLDGAFEIGEFSIAFYALEQIRPEWVDPISDEIMSA